MVRYYRVTDNKISRLTTNVVLELASILNLIFVLLRGVLGHRSNLSRQD